MKRIFKKRFSMMEVSGLLSVLLLGIGLYAWAATTVPYSFTAGSTAIATQVNANFNTLATAIDSVDSSVTPDQIRDKFYSGTSCAGNGANDIMVKVGPLCVDKYEASVWSMPDGTGIRFGNGSDNYGVAISDNGDSTAPVYALSLQGVVPSTYITWFQAQQACAFSGKRLLTNAEWQMAAAGTPTLYEPNPDNGVTDCNTSTAAGLVSTGTRTACVSNRGVNDMVGNASEWVADWMQGTNPDSTSIGPFGSDAIDGVNEVSPADGFPGALIRGGNFGSISGAGAFALDASHSPAFNQDRIGFRCAR
jgi:Sulfatase-modifying factor enzyme 1